MSVFGGRRVQPEELASIGKRYDDLARSGQRDEAKCRLDESHRREREIPDLIADLVEERHRLARNGGAARVHEIDAEIARLRIEEEVLVTSRGPLVLARDHENAANGRRSAAALDVRRGAFVDAAEPVLRDLLDAADRLAKIREASGLADPNTPAVFFDVAHVAAGLRARWIPEHFPEIQRQAAAGRSLLDPKGA